MVVNKLPNVNVDLSLKSLTLRFKCFKPQGF
jgi:hypothetical protein